MSTHPINTPFNPPSQPTIQTTLLTDHINAPINPSFNPYYQPIPSTYVSSGLLDLLEIHQRMQQFLQPDLSINKEGDNNNNNNNNNNIKNNQNHHNDNNNHNHSTNSSINVWFPLFDEQERLFEHQFTTIAYGTGKSSN